MSLRVLGLAVLFVVLGFGSAHAKCPDQRASCVLHEEGVALLVEGKNQPAAEKFAAAIAAEPTARSYLGYAQAVEALGQIALAYDTMVNAQKLSQVEMKTGTPNGEVTARAERIKYKLAELRAKIGFVWLRLPQGVQPQRVIAVQREGEGQLSAPLTAWTAVAPGKQNLIVTVDDGSKLTVVAQVAAGTQGVVVIPIAAPVGVRPPVPPVGGNPGTRPPPMDFPQKKPTPVYKKWWFWTLVIIGTLVIISAASSGPEDSASFRFDRPLPPPPPPTGATIFRF